MRARVVPVQHALHGGWTVLAHVCGESAPCGAVRVAKVSVEPWAVVAPGSCASTPNGHMALSLVAKSACLPAHVVAQHLPECVAK